jgi:oxygen-independent coproporphyrinogen-3 oxidase
MSKGNGHGGNGADGAARTNGNGHDHAAATDAAPLELKRGGFIAGYPPFEYLEIENHDKMWDKPRFGLYLHLPYCRKRCTFCFYKVYTNRHLLPMEDYLAALHKEIEFYGAKPEIKGRPVNTIYFGGGTPTTLSVEQMRALATKLRETFNITPDVEWTVEGEPGTLDEERAINLKEIGVTRLSLGVQSFNDELLARNGRSHGVSHALRAVGYARELKFPVMNIDLMSGMIDETPETWDASLTRSSASNRSTCPSTGWRSTRTPSSTTPASPARAWAASRPTRRSSCSGTARWSASKGPAIPRSPATRSS